MRGTNFLIAGLSLSLGACSLAFDSAQSCDSDRQCPPLSSCVEGLCVACPSCAEGELCLHAQCFARSCDGRPCPVGLGCVDGACADARCVGVRCAPGQVCASGACYPADCSSQACSRVEVCTERGCTPLACVDVRCPEGEACAGGRCYPADCSGLECAAGAACVEGACRPVSCVDLSCPAGAACAAGECLPTACSGVPCPGGGVCLLGTCVDPACVGLRCEAGSFCQGGACVPCEAREASCGGGVDEDCDGATDCGDPDCLDQVCGAESACARRTCSVAGLCRPVPKPQGTACRSAADVCDLSESCDGTSTECPSDAFDAASTCRSSAGACDVAESCDGFGPQCPPDAFDSASTCRTSAGVCDVAETCDGSGPQCPADAFDSLSTCRVSAGPCDVPERCDGAGPGCPQDGFDAVSTCRSAAGSCDVPESCDGTGPGCPQDGFDAVSTCRIAADLCDLAETCDGTGPDCPSDQLAPPTTECAPSVFCSGTSAQCPAGALTLTSANPLHNRLDTATFSGACSAGVSIVVSGTDDATVQCLAGTWAYTTAPQSTDAPRSYLFTQAGSSVSATWVRDTAGPTLVSAEINGGAIYATTPLLQMRVTASDVSTPALVRVAEASLATAQCQSQFADDGWQAYDPAQPYVVAVAPVDGQKKLCAWAKDSLGNVSVIAPPEGVLGRDADTIEYQAGNIPKITSFDVVNDTAGANFGTRTYAAGDRVRIEWTATDAEGLANDPIALHVTTDGTTWTPIAARYGGLTGNPTSYTGSYTAFTAPSSGFFRVKALAWDLAGNSSLAALSDSQNTPNWSIWAGSSDIGIGGSSRTASVEQVSNYSYHFDVDPTNGDVYAYDYHAGLLKMDAATGLVSMFLRRGTADNLPASGTLPADPQFLETLQFRFDRDGLLYVKVGSYEDADSMTVYQVDPRTRACRRYIGGVGNTGIDGGATPATVFAGHGPLAFDESHSLYFLANCTPGTWIEDTSTARLLKVTQNPDKTAGAVSVVAGNCVYGAPPRPGPAPALAAPLTDSPYLGMSYLEAWDNGNSIYYAFYRGGAQKIVNGQSQATDLPVGMAGGLFRNPANGKLYVSNGSVYEATPNLAGPNGDTATTWASSAGTSAACLLDGADAAQACVRSAFAARATSTGTVLFLDGSAINADRKHRIRFKDSQGSLRTLLGSLPFQEAGLSRRLVRASFAGIYYKRASEPNQAAFPAGLYFLDTKAPLFGYIDPATDVVSVLWGNQRLSATLHPTGTAMSPDLTLGDGYGADAQALTFDSNGLPWLRYQGALSSVDAARNIVRRQVNGGTPWENAADGANPASTQSWPYGLSYNLTMKNQQVFFLGGYLLPSGYTNTLTVKVFDFASSTGVLKLMGAARNTYSADESRPGRLSNLSLALSCGSRTRCFTQYQPARPPTVAQDRLYFGERDANGVSRVRYVATPSDPSTATLGTLFTPSGGVVVDNFSFTPDGARLLYIDTDGALRCHEAGLTAPKAWCNDSVLGPPAGLSSVAIGPNSLTWMDDTRLLISNYRGEIFLYELPP